MRLHLALALAALRLASSQDCTAPPPAKDFNFSAFSGSWFEIARIQTAGGAALITAAAVTADDAGTTP